MLCLVFVRVSFLQNPKKTGHFCILKLVSWLGNSPSSRGGLGYNGVWTISPPFLTLVKELLLLYYVKLHQIFVYSSGSFTTSWSHHRTIQLVPGILSASVKISYMVRQDTCSPMVAFRLQMYSPIGWSPAASIDPTIGGHGWELLVIYYRRIMVIYPYLFWWKLPYCSPE